ncbi:TPA: rhomboid family intramembrane serine protease [Pseudomonas aeruginosa]
MLFIAAGMCLIQLLNVLSGYALNSYGLNPRHLDGLRGIVLGPFLHNSWSHLLSNIVPFVVLGWFVSLISIRRFLAVSTVIIVVGGLLVWVLGRSGVHVGASGWVFGLWGYLIGRGWFERSFQALSVALLVLVLYGGLVFGFLPQHGVSFESHLAGALAGVIAALLFRPTLPSRGDEC